MRVLKFTLSGKTAFFKKPDVNTYFYFSYGHIHKVALLGMFGAIMGYRGYSHMTKEQQFPEFYQQLRDIQISIVPKNKGGYISKKVQYFNNSVGYASYEQGGNLIIKEQWLEEPKWDIYVLLNNENSEQLANYILTTRCVYHPYLGKNDHPADISDVSIIEDAFFTESVTRIDSLVYLEDVSLDWEDEEEIEGTPFKYQEYLPILLDEYTNLYQTKNFVYSNMYVNEYRGQVVNAEGKHIVFY